MIQKKMEPFGIMDHISTSLRNIKETKGELLNKIVNELMANCDTLEAVIIADWQGLSFASKLPKDVNEDEISATTLFTLEGAEGTRKELEKSLLGTKLSYLMMVTEKDGKPAYMFVFPIETLGYIACISYVREDMALIVQNMRIAAEKAAKVLASPEKSADEDTIEPIITSKYKNLLQKLETLKSVEFSFLEPQPASSPSQSGASETYPTVPIPTTVTAQPPPIPGPPPPPTAPLEFIQVETDLETFEPDTIIPPEHLAKFQVIFYDSKRIKYTVNIFAIDELDAQVKLQEMEQYHPIEIISVTKIG
ncbi:MAG: hypothetical protein ACTSQI_19715 [Candidatus Helarchaeota archaeon]